MRTEKDKGRSGGRQGVVAILASGFTLLVLVFSIGLAGTRPETSAQQKSAVTGAVVETRVQPTASEPVKPALIWTGKSEEDITQRRLPGHSECDLQLD